MTFLVVLFFVLSLLSGLFTGQISGAALLRGAEEGARLALSLAGPLCLWSGFAALLEDNGWSRLLARGLRPLLRRLFPGAMDDEVCAGALCGNLSANRPGRAADEAALRRGRGQRRDVHAHRDEHRLDAAPAHDGGLRAGRSRRS